MEHDRVVLGRKVLELRVTAPKPVNVELGYPLHSTTFTILLSLDQKIELANDFCPRRAMNKVGWAHRWVSGPRRSTLGSP